MPAGSVTVQRSGEPNRPAIPYAPISTGDFITTGLQSTVTLTLLNGNFIAGADSGDPSRSFNYVLLPSNFIASTEVYKSSEARLEEGGVGGTVILNTRRPFDLPAWSGFISAEGTYSDTTKKFDPQIAGQISWKDPEERLGFLVGAT